MPALVAFGRKWEIGSDDLVYPGIRNLFIWIPLFIGTVVIYWQNKDQLECNDGNYILYYLFGSTGILILMLLADICLIYNSASGGIMDVKARRFVPFWLYIKLLLYMMELGWNSLGTYGWKAEYFNCANAPDAVILIKGIIICNWIMLSMFLLFWMWQYDPFGRPSKSEMRPNYGTLYRESYEFPVTRRTSQWERRLRLIFCCICNDGKSRTMRDVYKEVSRGLSFLFFNSDLVMSDIIAGAEILNTKTELRRKRIANKERYDYNPFTVESSINFDAETKLLRLPPAEQWNSIPNILHYLNYALAIFTFPTVLTIPGNDMKTIFAKLHCCGCIPGRKKYSVHADYDTCCYFKTASLSSIVRHEDIVYASYDNSGFCSPFFVAVDSSRCSIDIVIRGGHSSIDYLAVLYLTPTNFDFPGIPSQFKAHRGMLAIAKSIKSKLDDMKLLEKLTDLYPTYRIMVTGISLGAGVATLLSMMIRIKYKNTKCIALAVPGATMSVDAAEYCNDFTTSVVYGDDIAPRVGIPSLCAGVKQIYSALQSCNIPKYQIQLGMVTSFLKMRSLVRQEVTESDANFTESEADFTEIGSSIGSSKEAIKGTGQIKVNYVNENTNDTTSSFIVTQPDSSNLVESPDPLEHFCQAPPGRILYVTETPLFYSKRTTCKGKVTGEVQLENPRWEVKWCDRAEFRELIFSDRMIMDHTPFRLLRSLKYFSRIGGIRAVNLNI